MFAECAVELTSDPTFPRKTKRKRKPRSSGRLRGLREVLPKAVLAVKDNNNKVFFCCVVSFCDESYLNESCLYPHLCACHVMSVFNPRWTPNSSNVMSVERLKVG